ncbi:hypothetical protein [Methylobacterium sp. CM6244]
MPRLIDSEASFFSILPVAVAESVAVAMPRLLAVAGPGLGQPLQVAAWAVGRAQQGGRRSGIAARLDVTAVASKPLSFDFNDLIRPFHLVDVIELKRPANRVDDPFAEIGGHWQHHAQTDCFRMEAAGL